MVSPRLTSWRPFRKQIAASQEPAEDERPTGEKSPVDVTPSQPYKTSVQLEKTGSNPAIEHTPGNRSVPGSDSQAGGADDPSSYQDDQKSGFVSYEKQEGEYPNEDDEFITNTRDETPKDEVVKLKYDILFLKDQYRNGDKAFIDYKIVQKKTWQEIHDKNKAQREKDKRGGPKPPNLSSKTHRWLYNNLVDRLQEYIVHDMVRCARYEFLVGEYERSEHYAEQALKQAAVLKYKPLSAWCRFHIGKAQYGQRRYEEALSSIGESEKASGLYVWGNDIDQWIAKAKAADMQQARGGTSSSEISSRHMNLEEELEGWGNSGSSNGSR